MAKKKAPPKKSAAQQMLDRARTALTGHGAADKATSDTAADAAKPENPAGADTDDTEESVTDAATVDKDEADATELPPEGFVLFVLAQRATGKLSQAGVKAELDRYLVGRKIKEQEHLCTNMRNFAAVLANTARDLGQCITIQHGPDQKAASDVRLSGRP